LDGGLASYICSVWKNKFVNDINNTLAGHVVNSSNRSLINYENTIIDANFNILSIDGFGRVQY
jgi:hypothetical protein